jgi:type 1 glutamine amidotransferase
MTPEQIRPLNIVLVAGPKDHGPGEHDYPRWQSRWAELLSQGDQVRISTAQEWPSRDQIDLADVLVLYFWNHQWTKERYNDLDRYMNRGGGIVVIHSATIADQQPETLAEWIGIAYQPGPSKYRHGRLTLEPSKKDHPITRGFSSTEFLDETYWNPFGLISRIDSLATAIEEGEPRPILWTYERGRGRVFASILGHYLWTFDDPVYRTVIFRGIAWAARQPEARLQSLATIGVTFQDD